MSWIIIFWFVFTGDKVFKTVEQIEQLYIEESNNVNFCEDLESMASL